MDPPLQPTHRHGAPVLLTRDWRILRRMELVRGGVGFLHDERLASIWRAPQRACWFTSHSDRLAPLRSLSPAPRVLGRTGPTWLYVNRPVS